MSEPKRKWMRWPYLWITWKPFIEDPLGPCTNVMKLVCDYAFEGSLQVVDVEAYDQLKAERDEMEATMLKATNMALDLRIERDQWKEMAERLVLAVRLEKGLFPSKFTNDILDEFEKLKTKL